MPDEIVTTEKTEPETSPLTETAPLETEGHDDPSSAKEADEAASAPEVHVDPNELGSGDETPSPAASEASEESALPASEDPHALGVDTGSDAPLVPENSKAEDAPEADKMAEFKKEFAAMAKGDTPMQTAEADSEPAKEPEKAEAAPEWEGPYTDTFDAAKGVVEVLGKDRADDLKDAANALFHVFESLIDKDLSGVDGQSGAILANVRNHGAGFLAATEAVFKRSR